jgi:hypothetical protein
MKGTGFAHSTTGGIDPCRRVRVALAERVNSWGRSP